MDEYASISQFISRAVYGIDHQRADIVSEAWAEDGHFTFTLDGAELRRAEGRDTIVGRLSAGWAKPVGTSRHIVTNLWVEEVDDVSAVAVYYLTLASGRAQPPTLRATGCYRDRLVRHGETWRWQERTLELDGPL
ncbi:MULTISPECIES: nuclear transport factor 2 family protein [Nocardiaceae]|uniref:SnoaL-like domain-containing protein n=1 Tax=Rhodococcoides corynebacterioides TaxID=53972 RepID=A0ABS2KN05_9NOCA|nr:MULTISPECIES: nuclear transport factor 2 family protein [Rhodococcus]MBM7413278.1 hypothetical protein [Rhodococcus corynebacterioides]MBP1115741.1 hypothetical protein [Rhodococcus sp. PvP016]